MTQTNPATRETLDPQMAAGAAVRQILLRQLDALEAQEAGTRLGEDPECLHDLRVAVRRTRSVLGQLKSVLPASARQHFREEFAWLGAATSPTRDLDVYLLQFPGFRDRLPAEQRDDLDPLHRFLLAHRAQEQARMVEALDSERYRRLKGEWRSFLEAEAGSGWPEISRRPLQLVADARLAKALGRVLRDGAAIGAQSPATELHELRKSGKKLRYLVEFFQPLYPLKPVGRLIVSLKGLQDNLGAFQDLQVQSEALMDFSCRMLEEGEVPPPTLLAMGMLVEVLRSMQQLAREEFAERFAGFDRGENRRLLNNLQARRSLAVTLDELKEKSHGQLPEGEIGKQGQGRLFSVREMRSRVEKEGPPLQAGETLEKGCEKDRKKGEG